MSAGADALTVSTSEHALLAEAKDSALVTLNPKLWKPLAERLNHEGPATRRVLGLPEGLPTFASNGKPRFSKRS